jgi:hypothetical protein
MDTWLTTSFDAKAGAVWEHCERVKDIWPGTRSVLVSGISLQF